MTITQRIGFNDATELADRLRQLAGNDVVYVTDRKGNTLEVAELRERKLSDGSMVYEIVLTERSN